MQNNKLTMFEWYGYQLIAGFAYFGWVVSSVFSYIGVISVTDLPWWMKLIAGVFSVGVNVVEFMFNRLSLEDIFHPESMDDVILTIFGATCYAYDYWTNMLGFLILFAHTANVLTVWHTDKTLFIWPSLFALGFAFGPEPLYKRFLRDCPAKPMRYKTTAQHPQNIKPTNYTAPTPSKSPSTNELLARLDEARRRAASGYKDGNAQR